MKNEKHKRLYNQLITTKLNFIGPGTHHIKFIYSEVKKQFPDLCDDNVICAEICKQGTQGPEWQHRVRTVLQKLKASSNRLSKGDGYGYWVFR